MRVRRRVRMFVELIAGFGDVEVKDVPRKVFGVATENVWLQFMYCC